LKVIGDQVLVLYRDRYYVVTGGAAQTKGRQIRTIFHFIVTAVWKLALKGEVRFPVTAPSGKDSVSTTPGHSATSHGELPILQRSP
jgi:hypothetical protein